MQSSAGTVKETYSSIAMPSTNKPSIPVRCNRTIFLRQLNGTRADLRHLVSGTRLSETTNYVRSKNKAVTDYADRTVGHWFKQQESIVDDLDRRQRGAYTKLGHIEQKRWCLKKQRNNGVEPLRDRTRDVAKLGSNNMLADDIATDKSTNKMTKLDVIVESGRSDNSGAGLKPIESVKQCPHYPVYRRNRHGKIVQSELPYRRKQFPLPQEEDPTQLSPRQKMKLRMAEEKERQDEKLHNFHEVLDRLASWNPLDDIRRHYHEEDDDEFSEDVYGPNPVNLMDVFNLHFLRMKNLDPNSQEALKACRYIRRKETSFPGLSKENTKDSIRSRISRKRLSRAAN